MKVLALSLTFTALFTIAYKDAAVAMPCYKTYKIVGGSSKNIQQKQVAATRQSKNEMQQTTAEIFDSMMYPLMAL
ncbi:hypothetical protein PDL71_09155 [Lacibacter sp. MH-610]|uniref:hypothetical protein n=1 Tax=Lacibacter sp. MH-610 TaxID=3020883 RepID=UPI00389219A7